MILAALFVFWLLYVEFRVSEGRHTPALYFLLYMSALMMICVLLSALTPFSTPGFFYLAIVAGTFWIGHLSGALVFARMGKTNPHGESVDILRALSLKPIFVSMNLLILIGIASGVVALIALVQAAKSAGISVSGLSDIPKLPAYFSEARYAVGSEDAEPLVVRFCTLILEAASLAAGLLRYYPAGRMQRLYQLSPLIASFLMTLMTGVRSYLFLNCTCYFGAFIAVLCIVGEPFRQLRSPRFLIKMAVYLTIAFLFGSAFALLRYAAENLQQPSFTDFMNQLGPLMASSLAAIVTATIVFDQTVQPLSQLHFASYSFAPVMAWLGLESHRYPPTVYLTSGLSDSNQYSLTGLLLLDFGPTLTALLFVMAGFLAAGCVFMARNGILMALPLLIAVICTILFSLITNFFFFTTHIVLFIGMSMIAMLLQRWLARRA